MQTNLAEFLRQTPDGDEAEAILRKCVHCGFCTATCPTYQLLGDELDGPRGRIYLIKQMVEGQSVTRETQRHLDRCLTCRSCESTCPSGVQYGRLADIGRRHVDAQVGRPAGERALRWTLARVLPNRALFTPALRLGQQFRTLLPRSLREKVPHRQRSGSWPQGKHARRMLMLEGCVQPGMLPNVNKATARVMDALGIEMIRPASAGCCGAIRLHLNYHDDGLDDVRVACEGLRLEQVLINLVGNAIDAVLSVSGTHAPPSIWIDVDADAQWVRIYVRDNGPGISEAHMPRLFEPFFSTKEGGQGMGLGLAISSSIAQENGGQLVARNVPGGGAEFLVTLRRVQRSTSATLA